MVPTGVSAQEREDTLAQIELILKSDTFRTSDASRHLLKFLADRYVAGEADQLKEYSVGIDALGKPPTYDPRHDSTVRLQMSRLRQKLADYYRTEGKTDPLIIELPKGRFKLSCEPRAVEELPAAATPIELAPARSGSPSLGLMIAGGAAAVLAIALMIVSIAYWREREETAIFRSTWTPALQELWKPYLASRRPLLISIGDPPFVQFEGFGLYRNQTLNRWEDIIKSPEVQTIRKALHDAEMQPSAYFAPVGEVSASFLLGRLLGPRVPSLSLVRASELSWQQLADNNLIYVGPTAFIRDRLAGLPAQMDLQSTRGGIRNAHPHPGEQEFYPGESRERPFDDGEVNAMISRLPGPRGTSDITSFTSVQTPGRLAAVQWFVDESYARTLVDKMRKPSGEIPRYYQVLLKVKFKGGVPTETSYVMHHEIAAEQAK